MRQSGSFSGEQVELSQVTLTVTDMDKVRPAGDVIRDLLQRYHAEKRLGSDRAAGPAGGGGAGRKTATHACS